MNMVSWCNRIITICFGLLFGLVPLLLTPWNFELFEYNKMMAVYGLTVVIVGTWIIKMIAQKEIRVARTPLDIPLALFLSSQLLSSLFSIDPHVSWFGYYSRFNGGMLSIICYVLLFYAFISNLNSQFSILKVALASAVLVSLYAVAERLGVDKHLWVQDVQNRVFSTLGQPNWLAAYLVALIPVTFALSLKNYFWTTISILFFLVLLFTRSRSGLLGFAVADVIFWGLVFLRSHLAFGKERPFRAFFILHSSFSILIFLNGTHVAAIDRWLTLEGWKSRLQPTTYNLQPTTPPSPQGTLLEYGGTESGKIRNYVWQGAMNAWKSSTKTFFIGTGTETFAFAFFRYKPIGHNLTSEWDFLYNKAHNEYLNYLTTTGVLGLGSYLLLIGTFLVWFLKFSIFNFQFSMKISNFKFQIALFAGWISVLITNFFGFSVVMTNLFLFLFPAMVIVIRDKREVISKKIKLPQYSVFLVLLALLALLVLLTKNWYADTRFAAGSRWSRAGEYAAAYPLLKEAVQLNPGEPLYHDEYASALAGLAPATPDLLKQSLAESDRAIATSPQNVNFAKTRTKIFYSFSASDPQWNNAAIEALEKASELSPLDPKIFYNLAILYGRQADNAKAIETLIKTIDLKPNYRDAYYALWVFYTETRERDKARELLQTYLSKVDPNDKDFQERVKQ